MDSVTAVNITPKAGKSREKITIYYNNGTSLPQTSGAYAVTFDVAVAAGWEAASDLSAGTLTIGYPFYNVLDFAAWLDAQPANTAYTAYFA